MSLNIGIAENTLSSDSTCRYHPFREESQILSFCDTQEVKSIRKIIKNGLESSPCLQVIYGEKGIGKTMLARNLSLSRRLNSQIIKGSSGLTVVNLMKRLCTAINSPMCSLTTPPMKQIKNFVKNFTQQEKPLCLIIDDAQLIPLQTLAAIIHCNNKIILDGREDFNIALLGTPDLREKISPLLSEDDKLETNIVELKRYNEESIIHYIYTKLRHAGWKGPLPMISNNELKSIKNKSGGIPRNINHVIGYHYFDNWNSWNNQKNSEVKSIPDSQQILFLVIGLALVLAVMSWTNQHHNIIDYYLSTSDALVNKLFSIFG